MSIAAERLQGFIHRIEKLMEEKKGVQSDIRDVFSEAKGVGFDVPAMRKVIQLRAMDQTDRDELECLIDTYMHAMDAPKREAVEAMQKGAGTREAARKAGIAVGSASQLRSGVHGIGNDEHVHENENREQHAAPHRSVSDSPPQGMACPTPTALSGDAVGNNSESCGGVESRHAKAGNMPGSVPGEEMSASPSRLVGATEVGSNSQSRAGVAPGPQDPINDATLAAMEEAGAKWFAMKGAA